MQAVDWTSCSLCTAPVSSLSIQRLSVQKVHVAPVPSVICCVAVLNFMQCQIQILCVYRRIEKPQRPYKVSGMDVSKQVVSSAAAHVCGKE